MTFTGRKNMQNYVWLVTMVRKLRFSVKKTYLQVQLKCMNGQKLVPSHQSLPISREGTYSGGLDGSCANVFVIITKAFYSDRDIKIVYSFFRTILKKKNFFALC